MMCWQAHWLFLNQWEFFRQDRENILTECVLSENARKSPIIPWMIVKPLKMVKTRVVHAGPADEVCRIIWMAWNKKGNRQETPDHLEFIDPECSPAPLHSNNLFSSLLLHNRLHTVALPYSETQHNCANTGCFLNSVSPKNDWKFDLGLGIPDIWYTTALSRPLKNTTESVCVCYKICSQAWPNLAKILPPLC